MLELNRRIGEAVQVGKVRVVVIGIHNGRVKLGFDGPDSTPIWREELVEQMEAGGQPVLSHAKLHRAVREQQGGKENGRDASH